MKSESNGQYSFVHNFPSGVIAFDNDFRKFFIEELNEIDEYITKKSGYDNSICSNYGQELYAKFSSEQGLVYITLGNISPSIYHNKEKNIITSKRDYLYDKEKNTEKDTKLPDEELKGSICTDLWAVCAVDYDLLKKQAKKYNLEPTSEFNIQVEPGEYKITSYYNDNNELIKYFSIEKYKGD